MKKGELIDLIKEIVLEEYHNVDEIFGFSEEDKQMKLLRKKYDSAVNYVKTELHPKEDLTFNYSQTNEQDARKHIFNNLKNSPLAWFLWQFKSYDNIDVAMVWDGKKTKWAWEGGISGPEFNEFLAKKNLIGNLKDSYTQIGQYIQDKRINIEP